MPHPVSNLSVVTVPLPGIDRRALSQAWYSALHIAPHECGAAAPARSPLETRLPVTRIQGRAPETRPNATVATNAAPQRADAQNHPHTERRTAPVPLARKVVRAFERRLCRRAPAGIALRTDAGRVHVLIRRDGGALRLVALCTPALRDNVERALAQARYALAARGIAAC